MVDPKDMPPGTVVRLREYYDSYPAGSIGVVTGWDDSLPDLDALVFVKFFSDPDDGTSMFPYRLEVVDGA